MKKIVLNISKLLAISTIVFSYSCSNNCNTDEKKPSEVKKVQAYNIDSILDALPPASRWVDHLNKELLPFWMMKEAIGTPIGKFPSCRCNDGTIPKSGKVSDCPEYKFIKNSPNAPLFKDDSLYTRVHARQTYAYGVAYHMTGEVKYLELMKKGVEFLRKNAIDRTNGSAFSYYSENKKQWGPVDSLKISQDMAYALSGIGFYYYLTHDKDVLPDILGIKNYIFKTYYDKNLDMLKWCLGTKGEDNPHRKELVSQLDQVYAYMLWLTPSLPLEYRAEWEIDLSKVANIMVNHFFSEKYQFFWGILTDNKYVTTPDNPADKANTNKGQRLGAPHTDFGHSIKTLWLIYEIGKMRHDMSLLNFAREKAANLIDIAYDQKSKCWTRRFDAQGKLDKSKEWWSMAELDQTTATLSLADPSFARYLGTTYRDWFDHMVDTVNHEVWHMVDENNKPDVSYPKQHIWKNSFHSFEHALIGYMTTHTLKHETFTLYYAFTKDADTKYIHPYFYNGKIVNVKKEATQGSSFTKYKVEFSDLN